MTEDILRQRQADQVNAALPFGWNSGMIRISVEQAALINHESDMANWPIYPGAKPLQDPTTGQLYFVPGISDPGGGDIIAP